MITEDTWHILSETTTIVTSKLAANIAAIAIYILLRIALRRVYKRYSGRSEFTDGRRRNTLKILFMFINLILSLILLLFILQNSGVNISSLLASLGITGAIIGLAFQDFLRDLIMGYNIISSHFFSVGDVIKYEGVEGVVVYSDLKITKIRSIEDESVISISNRNLDRISRSSTITDIDVPLSYEDDFEKCRAVLSGAAEKIQELEGVKKARMIGTQSFNDSSVSYRVRF